MTLLGIVGVIVAAVVLALITASNQAQQLHQQREWLAAAKALQLQASGGDDQRSLRGTVQGVPAQVEFVRESRRAGKSSYQVETTTFQAGGDGRIPASLDLRQEDPWGVFGRLLEGPDPEVGDADFDRLVDLQGMDAYVCAALSESARKGIEDLVTAGGKVSGGVVLLPVEDAEDPSSRWLTRQIELVAALAASLGVTPDTLAQRLAHNALHDSRPEVRLQNLRFLLAPETPAPATLAAETARALLSDPSDAIRIHAARHLGAAGHPTLRSLVVDARAKPALRAHALDMLHEGNAAGIDDWVASILTPSPRELVCAALVVVGSRRLSAHVERVIELTRAADVPIRVAATRALGQLESPLCERGLIQRLADDESEVRAAAAEALGSVGSVAAVEPLLALTKGIGRAPHKQAARGAITRIQARLGEVDAGRLSLVEDDDLSGAVALADPEAPAGGEVTLASEEAAVQSRRT
jgi:HEAT repeat protein